LKIKLIRADLGVAAEYDTEHHESNIDRSSGRPLWKVGAVVEVDSFGASILVGNGDAEPADDEAEAVCVGWKFRRDDVLLAREMLEKGIDPDDRQRFRDGEILGYDADGNDIPGPNWKGEDDSTGD
jgi:hypothetical protein